MYRLEINDADLLVIDRLAAGLEDMTPAMQEIAEYMVMSTKDRFPAGVSPEGIPWAPKSQTTLDEYARRGDRQDPRPLFGPSGNLSQMIFGQSGPDWAEWGSPMIYSAVMQFGAAQHAFGPVTPWGDIPARPFLGVSETDKTALTEIVSEYIDSLSQPG